MKFFGILCAVKAHAIATTFTFGGNPVVSSKGTSYFNDMLGTTLGAKAFVYKVTICWKVEIRKWEE